MTRRHPYPICLWCKYYHEESYSCEAFPDGIPYDIRLGEYSPNFDHRLPHPDDRGIQFEKADYQIIKQRGFFDRFQSEELAEAQFEQSAHWVRMAHENRIKLLQDPRQNHYIVPLDITEAQALRDRCKDWGFDLSTRDNQVIISGDLYRKIHNDMQAYIKWLEVQFSSAKTIREGAMVFGEIADMLRNDKYP